jgi:hypothetical protein
VKSSSDKLSRGWLAAAAIALAAVSFSSPNLAKAQAPAPASAQAAAQEKQAARPPKLVVVIVVDQMRADYVQRFRGEWHGGLGRLVNQGAWFQNAAYPYSGTETCPGHATIATGDYPHTHGIIGNTWWDRAAAQPITCTQDSGQRDVGAGQIAVSDSSSRLLVPTFAERLRAARPGSRVVTISLKARAAIMLAGHHADAVLWQDEFTGDWFTSSAYSQSLPAFANDFIAANPFSADASKVWEPSLPKGKSSNGASTAGEGPPAGWTTAFPHPISPANDRATARALLARWRASPFGDEYLERLAEAAIDNMKLGRGPQTDYLGVSFSSPDYIGHAFGPDSIEIEDEYVRLDATIGKLLDDLDRTAGAGNYVVMLTGDHGVAPVVQQAQSQGLYAGHVDTSLILSSVKTVLYQRWGRDPILSHAIDETHMIEQNIYFRPEVLARVNADSGLWPKLKDAMMVPGVAAVFTDKELQEASGLKASSKDRLQHAAALDDFPGRTGDAVVTLKPYWILGGTLGTSHGTANNYDQHVPILLFGAGIKPGEYMAAASPADIAPTLTVLCSIPPAKTEGRVLYEAIEASKRPAAAPAKARAKP